MNRKVIMQERCYLCGSDNEFSVAEKNTLLREARCCHCGASIRNSDTARIVAQAISGDDRPLIHCLSVAQEKRVHILDAAASGPLHQLLRDLPDYVAFEYMEGVQPGEIRNGVLCDDLTNLSFKDKTFDLVISQDVMEHIDDVESALYEINRVLVVGGSYIFSVPIHEGQNTATRANKRSVFHGDPLRPEGALVYVDWGDDIAEVIKPFGYQTTVYKLHSFHPISEVTQVDNEYTRYLQSPAQEFFRYNSHVVRAVKLQDSLLTPPKSNHLRIVDFGPRSLVVGETFNRQPGGENALWTKGQNVTVTTAIVLDGIRLHSQPQPQAEVVTGVVPEWLTSTPGRLALYLEDTLSGRRSKPSWVTVTAHSDKQEDPTVHILRHKIVQLERELHSKRSQEKPSFEGWQMTTRHAVPWEDTLDWADFRKSAVDIKRIFNFGLARGIGIDRNNVDSLLWRHWNVAFAVRHALTFAPRSDPRPLGLVEFGVGDGMSAFFILRELSTRKARAQSASPLTSVKLYDAWHLLKENASANLDDRQLAGIYSNNSMARTEANLTDAGEPFHLIPGLLPDILVQHPAPENIIFLHIDLNSAAATQSVIEHCLPRLAHGAVILFDDYGWQHFRETKKLIDAIFVNQDGTLFKLPTGQALYFAR